MMRTTEIKHSKTAGTVILIQITKKIQAQE